MRLAVAALTLLLSATAQAGGIGVLVHGGAHSERMWFHSNASEPDDNGDVAKLTDPDQFEKFEMVQTLPQMGGGLELILGDRDDKITGVFRVTYMQDAPQADPAELTDEVDAEYVVSAYRDTPRHVGVGVVGLNFGILGRPDSFQAGLTAHVGTGFLTNDHTEFLVFDAGPSFSYKFTRQMQAFGDLTYVARHRKGFSHGGQVIAGVRYLFD